MHREALDRRYPAAFLLTSCGICRGNGLSFERAMKTQHQALQPICGGMHSSKSKLTQRSSCSCQTRISSGRSRDRADTLQNASEVCRVLDRLQLVFRQISWTM